MIEPALFWAFVAGAGFASFVWLRTTGGGRSPVERAETETALAEKTVALAIIADQAVGALDADSRDDVERAAEARIHEALDTDVELNLCGDDE